jgi:hypothetical protein
MEEESKDKTAFVNHLGLFRFNNLPMGISSTPAGFMSLMNSVFRGLTYRYVCAYLDDLLIYGSTFDQHLKQLETVFERLKEYGLKLHPQKCTFAADECVFLGYKLSSRGIEMEDKKIEAIREWPTPTNVKLLRSFVGFVAFYRAHVRHFSEICAPFYRLFRKDATYEWDEQCEASFRKLKEIMCNGPIRAYPNMNKTFELYTDGSMTAIGWVLTQRSDQGRPQIISCGGRSLSQAERNYTVSEVEGLALIEGVKANREYLTARPFKIFTDHVSLCWLKSLGNASGRLLRWAIFLAGFNYTIEHKEGKTHHVDAVSRIPYHIQHTTKPTVDIQSSARCDA